MLRDWDISWVDCSAMPNTCGSGYGLRLEDVVEQKSL